MKAVILAAGRGKRMGRLTDDCPKSLLKYKDKSLIAHTLAVIPSSCKEIIIVIGYLGDQIQKAVGDKSGSIPIKYIESELRGTGFALWQAKRYLTDEDFIVLAGDDVYSSEDIRSLAHVCPAILVSNVTVGNVSGGKITIDKYGKVKSIIEGIHSAPAVISTGAYHLTPGIFEYPLIQIPGRDEYGLPQTILEYLNASSARIVKASIWKQIITPADLL